MDGVHSEADALLQTSSNNNDYNGFLYKSYPLVLLESDQSIIEPKLIYTDHLGNEQTFQPLTYSS